MSLNYTFAGIVMGAAAAGQLIEDHAISLPTVCAVGAVVLGGTWWLSHKFAEVEADSAKLHEAVLRIETKMNALPCQMQPPPKCEEQKP